jgi:hypothetical protein
MQPPTNKQLNEIIKKMKKDGKDASKFEALLEKVEKGEDVSDAPGLADATRPRGKKVQITMGPPGGVKIEEVLKEAKKRQKKDS